MRPDREWYATLTFRGTPTDDELETFLATATIVSAVNDVVTARFVVWASDFPSAVVALKAVLDEAPTSHLMQRGVLSEPVGFEVIDGPLHAHRAAIEAGLPPDTPWEEQGRLLMEQLAKLPPATDADRRRWRADDEAVEVPGV